MHIDYYYNVEDFVVGDCLYETILRYDGYFLEAFIYIRQQEQPTTVQYSFCRPRREIEELD